MTQLRKQIARAANAALALAVVTVLASACDRSTPVATTDTMLRRDLTLASSEFAPASSMGDTAVASPGRVLPNASTGASPRTPATAKPRAPKPAPVKAPVKAPAPPVVASEPRPTPPSGPPPVTTTPVEPPKVEGIGGSVATAPTSTGAAKTIGRGVALVGKTNAAICSRANRPGDRLVAILANEVVSPDGARLAAGTPILVEMAAPATNGDFVFRVKAVMVNGVLVPVEGVVAVDGPTTQHRVSNGGAGTKIAGGAIVGAILGGIFGGGKGAAIGAAGGAAAGTVAAAGNSVSETCLPPGTALTVTLSAPLVLSQGTP